VAAGCIGRGVGLALGARYMCNLEAHQGWPRCKMAEGCRRAMVCVLKLHEALGTRAICWIVVQKGNIAVNVRDGSVSGASGKGGELECGSLNPWREILHRARQWRP